ncbi:MAG: aspartate aminotransferase family protein [Deltaproteobacteria bacterium]|nr:aspartate aminotransferase family protein [Deltaproteobacteria bacterium]
MSKTIFPETPKQADQILAALAGLGEDDLRADGKAFAFIYSAGEAANALARRAFAQTMGGNGLDPTVYPSARRLENDLVAVGLEHLRAPEGAVGTVTSGGTESVMLSVKAARDHARKTRPELVNPKILVPETAHASFHKAGHYLGIEVEIVDIDPVSMTASVADMAARIDERTILLVASAPSYAHGVIDPIAEIGALAEQHDLLFHVDACIGGWVLPFERELGVDLPDFDFEVDGVTSMSVDLHKYGFTPKGCSLILHRRPELREAQYYACATWSGYSIINSTIQGSKSLAPMGAAWAVMQGLGRSGYRSLVATMWAATGDLVEGVSAIDGLRVLGKPAMGLVAITTDDGDLFTLADRLTAAGWHLQPTYAFGRSPAHIHFTIDPSNAGQVGAFLADLREQACDLPATTEPPAPVVAMLSAVAGGAAGVPIETVMYELGIRDGKLPAEQATIHRLLNAASPEVREQLLTQFMGGLFS